MDDTAALYIHIPFCVRKCLYCAFASTDEAPLATGEYAALLLREMALRAAALASPLRATTLYLGGGTPSLLEPDLVGNIIDCATRLFRLDPAAEITLEANPGTVTADSLAGYRTAGVNRLSLGVQSLDDRMLVRLGRVHTAQEAKDAFALARRAGFDNIGIDLIHGLPGQSLDHWRDQLRMAAALRPEHISAYGLTVEEGTPFARQEDQGELTLPDEDDAAAMFEETSEILAAAGYEQYEIANFALPGCRSRHNQVYWRRGNYLGFGAGAHSFLREPFPGLRWRNPDDLGTYGCPLADGVLPETDITLLAEEDAMAEWLFLGLRMLEGIEEARFREEFCRPLMEIHGTAIEGLNAAGLLVREGGRLRLTRRGVILSNRVFAAFL
ncbi:radical SAM family heme chaperone HemW [Geobacter grbiciae]|uniref:radical SAM family heme chaperone HemW n=1 Tax=Geobacter grbiciae TaxID=155042 RepID=UPI001C0211A8|nr:radical SAM family heme chaperone HemW [Geobacter grbiciae]MBT1073893.1 radical SAM family heme chaperone HemW [Geobacter grbiciae]